MPGNNCIYRLNILRDKFIIFQFATAKQKQKQQQPANNIIATSEDSYKNYNIHIYILVIFEYLSNGQNST